MDLSNTEANRILAYDSSIMSRTLNTLFWNVFSDYQMNSVMPAMLKLFTNSLKTVSMSC